MESLLNSLVHDSPYLARLVIAMILGGLIGLERQTRGRSAGLRTNILVCLGSAAVIVAFEKLSLQLPPGSDAFIRMDPARAAAGVITGIGFLGAGTIVKSRDFVRGLTTAASIWVVAAIGVTVGLGEYIIAVTLAVLVLIALYLFHRLPIKADMYYSLHLSWHGDPALLDDITEQLVAQKVYIKSRNVTCRPEEGACRADLSLRMCYRWYENDSMRRLLTDPRFEKVGWS